jgi:hypothetical protein
MSWVLVLTSNVIGEPPAIIGGYDTREVAETVGRLAITTSSDYKVPPPHYRNYLVIPGAACSQAFGSTYGRVDFENTWEVDTWKREVKYTEVFDGRSSQIT